METRKVQLSGGTTYTVSLPKPWAREHGIDAGTTLFLQPEGDGSLLIDTAVRDDERRSSVRIDAGDVDENTLLRSIRAAYVVGIDELEVVDRSEHPPERRSAVTEAVNGLSGLEVVEATAERIVVRDLLRLEGVSVRKSTLRLHLVTLAMHRDAVTAVREHDVELAEQVIDRDTEADKLTALVTRLFRRTLTDLHETGQLCCSRDELFGYYHTATQLERVADHAEKMARLTTTLDGPLPEPPAAAFADHARDARRLVERACDVVFGDPDAGAAHRVFADCDELVAELEAFDRELFEDDATDAYAVSLLLDSVRRTAGYAQNVAELGIQQTIGD